MGAAEPALVFDEADIARIATAVALSAERQARTAVAEELAGRQAAALELAASALRRAAAAREQAVATGRDHILRLAGAISQALAAGSGQSLVSGAIERLLRMAPEVASARLRVEAGLAEALRPQLSDLAHAAGFTGMLELEIDSRLPAGAVQLLWSDGWLEHAPERVGGLIDQALMAASGSPFEGHDASCGSDVVHGDGDVL